MSLSLRQLLEKEPDFIETHLHKDYLALANEQQWFDGEPHIYVHEPTGKKVAYMIFPNMKQDSDNFEVFKAKGIQFAMTYFDAAGVKLGTKIFFSIAREITAFEERTPEGCFVAGRNMPIKPMTAEACEHDAQLELKNIRAELQLLKPFINVQQLVIKYARKGERPFLDILKDHVCDSLRDSARNFHQRFNSDNILKAQDLQQLIDAILGQITKTVTRGRPPKDALEIKETNHGVLFLTKEQQGWNQMVNAAVRRTRELVSELQHLFPEQVDLINRKIDISSFDTEAQRPRLSNSPKP